ncbi:MAG: sensor domain-containing diguanylate cyclase [Candidatus Cloacimonetes bacterium]|nr:sensor domain-containing diguanylate cyclase [Candidatus Cloacimonadota bacterium]
MLSFIAVGLIIFTMRRKIEHYRIIEEWKIIETELRESEKRFSNLFEEVPTIAVYGFDPDRKIIFWNKASEILYGFSKEEALGKKVEDLIILPEMRMEIIEKIEKWVNEGVQIFSGEMELMKKDRSLITVLSSYVMLKNGYDRIELYSLNIDFTKRKSTEQELLRSYKRLKKLSRTDSLTQLSNRRNILEKIYYEQVKFGRSKESFALVLGDLDNFKTVNDRFGHDCGDFVLKYVANLMLTSVRKQDVVSRYGGDEFLLLLPQTSPEGAKHIAEKIRNEISTFVITYKDKEISITVTFGIGIYDKQMSIGELIKKTDNALYEGKLKGKNVIVMAKEKPSE